MATAVEIENARMVLQAVVPFFKKNEFELCVHPEMEKCLLATFKAPAPPNYWRTREFVITIQGSPILVRFSNSEELEKLSVNPVEFIDYRSFIACSFGKVIECIEVFNQELGKLSNRLDKLEANLKQ